MPAAKVLYEDDHLQIATWSRVFISRWRAAATKEQLVILCEHQLALIEAVGDRRIAVITVLEDKTGLMPSSDARKEAEAVAKATRDAVMLQAQIVEGEGFVAATFRALLTGVMLAIRAPYPNKVFRTVDDAMPWIEEHLHVAGYQDDAAGVSAAVSGLRDAV
jgi:hypothetical protein